MYASWLMNKLSHKLLFVLFIHFWAFKLSILRSSNSKHYLIIVTLKSWFDTCWWWKWVFNYICFTKRTNKITILILTLGVILVLTHRLQGSAYSHKTQAYLTNTALAIVPFLPLINDITINCHIATTHALVTAVRHYNTLSFNYHIKRFCQDTPQQTMGCQSKIIKRLRLLTPPNTVWKQFQTKPWTRFVNLNWYWSSLVYMLP